MSISALPLFLLVVFYNLGQTSTTKASSLISLKYLAEAKVAGGGLANKKQANSPKLKAILETAVTLRRQGTG